MTKKSPQYDRAKELERKGIATVSMARRILEGGETERLALLSAPLTAAEEAEVERMGGGAYNAILVRKRR